MSILKKIKDISRSIRRALGKKNKVSHWRATVATIVTNYQRHWVLFVLSTGSNTWSPPKGGVEVSDGLSLEEAALRELWEEVRLKRTAFVKRNSAAGGTYFAQYLGSAEDRGRPGRWEDELQLAKHMHCVHLLAGLNCNPNANRKENISKFVWVKSRKQFNELPMPDRRRVIWLAAMKEAGVPWAQEV